MLAILLAGGEGERLRPLTCTLPKPMALVLGQPVLAHTLNLLKKHGITEIAMTLGYMPEKIMDEFLNGEDYGVNIRYYTEDRPLGTAGSVRRAKDFLTETFCVVSADTLTDVDLTSAYRFHKEKGALATMLLKRVSNPTAYGLVNTDQSGRVISFQEKPSWRHVNTDTANTGIYILEPEVLSHIPENGSFDFGNQLFPLLVKQGAPVYGCLTDQYWCDIGSISAYLAANRDALLGKIDILPMPDNGILRMSGAIVDERAHLEAPVYIGAHARIDAGSFIGAGSVICDHAHVCANASVKRSIIYPSAKIGSGAQLRACVVCAGASLQEGASAFEESIIGADSLLERHASVRPGIKIWPGKRVFEGAQVSANMIWGQRTKRYFSGFTLNSDTPEECALIARTLAWKTGIRTALVGRSTAAVSASQERAFVSGLLGGGVQVYLAGECTMPALRHMLLQTKLDAAFHMAGTEILSFESSLLPLSPVARKAAEASLSRQDVPPPYTGYTKRAESAGRFDLSYLAFLLDAYASPIRKNKSVFFAANEQLSYLAERVMHRLSLSARVEWEEDMMELEEDEDGFYLSEDGGCVRFADAKGLFNEAENEILLARVLSFLGETVLHAPPGATHALQTVLNDPCVEIRYASDEYEWLKSLKAQSLRQFFMRTDGLYASVCTLSYLAESGMTLSEFRASLPSLVRVSREITLPQESRAQTLRKFREALPDEFKNEDWYFERKNASAWLAPSDTRPVLTLTSEADTMEAANDMMDALSALIETAKKQ